MADPIAGLGAPVVPESRPKPDALAEQRKLRASIERFLPITRRIAGYAAIATLGAGASFYLFWPMSPWCEGAVTEKVHLSPHLQTVIENQPLDLYVARDASLSADKRTKKPISDFDWIQEDIFANVAIKLRLGGDRMSYCRFGSDTSPKHIQPASPDGDSIHTNMKTPFPPEQAGKTDFAVLFDHLREAIGKERKADAVTSRPPHPDLVLIVSDGVPDDVQHNRVCPDQFAEAGEPFISEDIRKAFEALVNHSYPKGGNILPFLVLAGGQSRCVPEIQAEWEAALGGLGLKVVTYPQLRRSQVDLWDAIWTSVKGSANSKNHKRLEREPCLFLRPLLTRLEDAQIANFLAKREFSARYLMWSYSKEAKAAISSAALLDNDNHELSKLYVVNDHGQYPFQTEGQSRVSTSRPPEDDSRGPVTTKTLWFKFDADDAADLTLSKSYAGYRVRIFPELADGSVKCQHADDLIIDAPAAGVVRADLIKRVKQFAIVITFPTLAYLVMVLLFAYRERMWNWLKLSIFFFAIKPLNYWFAAFLVLVTLVTLSWMCVIHPASVFIAPLLATIIGSWFKYIGGSAEPKDPADGRKAEDAAGPGSKDGINTSNEKPAGHHRGHSLLNPELVALELLLLPALEWTVFLIGSRM